MWETHDLKLRLYVVGADCGSQCVVVCVRGSLGQLSICSVSIVALCGGRASTSYKRTNTSESHTHSSSCHSALGENKSYSEVLQLPQQQDYERLRGSQVGIKDYILVSTETAEVLSTVTELTSVQRPPLKPQLLRGCLMKYPQWTIHSGIHLLQWMSLH